MSICHVPKRDTCSTFLRCAATVLLEGLSARLSRLLSVISELEGDAEVVAAEQADDILKLVL